LIGLFAENKLHLRMYERSYICTIVNSLSFSKRQRRVEGYPLFYSPPRLEKGSSTLPRSTLYAL
jgi:hypothetical protein